jgi:hypothetical protein
METVKGNWNPLDKRHNELETWLRNLLCLRRKWYKTKTMGVKDHEYEVIPRTCIFL